MKRRTWRLRSAGMALLLLMAPVAAQESLGASSEARSEVRTETTEERLQRAGGALLNLALDQLSERRNEKAGARSAQESGVDAGGEPSVENAPVRDSGRPPKWSRMRDRMIDSLISESLDVQPGETPSDWLARVLRETLDIVVHDYNEYFKNEGRAFARELSENFVNRVREDEKISAALFSVQLLCWGVIIYLTLVTLAMLVYVRLITSRQKQLMQAFTAMRKRSDQPAPYAEARSDSSDASESPRRA